VNAVRDEVLRRARGETPRGRLGLAIEGGAMRGVIAGGMVAGLESHGVRPECFDAVFGSSAGAISGAYFLAEQARWATTIYFEDVIDDRFIDRRNVLRGEPVVGIEYLVDEVMTTTKPLDHERVIASGRLHPVATRVDTASRHVFEPARSRRELHDQLRCSARIPLFAGPPTELGDVAYLDAALSEAIPWQAAIDAGCDHVLVLSTRPLGVGKRDDLASSTLAWYVSRRVPDSVRALVRGRARASAEQARALKEASEAGRSGDAAVLAVCPSADAAGVGQFEQRPERLVAGARAGFNALEAELGFELTREFVTAGRFDRVGEPDCRGDQGDPA
jgi:predicted patatin/cPLA2 family phospholipase